jgi:hypothetical protein
MKSSIRLAGAAVLCASLLLAACAKHQDSSTTTSTDATKTTDTSIAATPGAGTSAPDATAAADATAAPADTSTAAAAATVAAAATTAADASATTSAATGSSGAGSTKFIEMPVYPGSAELKDQDISVASNGSSVVIKVYSTKDDTKHVIDWYKSHLPASWKNFQLSSGDKTTGSFTNEGSDGDQTVLIATQDDKTSRIQLSTKHGK